MPPRPHASQLSFLRSLLFTATLLYALCPTPYALSPKLYAQNPTPYALSPKPFVVMLSMDGYRWDYPEQCHTPNLDRIADRGVKAHSIQSAFPSKTFPNHYTMATGLYPDNHGIVQNSFYDPETSRKYAIRDRDAVEDPSFYGGEPIWVTAEKNGITSASFFWVGSEAPIKGIQPTYWKKYDHNFPFENRIDTVIYWLNLPEEKRPRLVMWYFDEPDGIGHTEGPHGEATFQMVAYLDSLLGVFLDKLEQLPHAHEINVIVTSDHGMGINTPDKHICLKHYIETDWFREIEGWNPNFIFKVKENYYDTAWQALQAIPHVSVWKHGEVPERLNYGRNPRTRDFILVADSAWQVSLTGRHSNSAGAHGYDPFKKDMHAIFYAKGLAFKQGYVHPTFENIHLYPLICEILGIEPAPIDGHIDYVKEMLRP
ncbi:MAG: ectonucleotide pyrophosphatase/phosphodiesterase [Bacteroidales bacterium]|nr:ectonucleotide pyrophosphatase/phosphodiesterase [Bacteroidales bacterium]